MAMAKIPGSARVAAEDIEVDVVVVVVVKQSWAWGYRVQVSRNILII